MKQPTFFDSQRTTLEDSIEMTAQSLAAYGERYDHWAFAYSGGKDSTACLTVAMHLLKTGRIPRPKRITVCYADTRMELPPLAASAYRMLGILRDEGIETRVAVAPMDKRFFVYMLGRGVPPPNNRTLRWCTRQIKVDPMVDQLKELVGGLGGKVLMITGVRQGESAIRDQRIALSCSKDGSECGQGWYQETLPESLCDTLAPILHWRTCLVWDWLMGLLSPEWRHGYPTEMVGRAYGFDLEGSAAEVNARTGCVGCPLANQDSAIDNLLSMGEPEWEYLRPLTRLRPLYRWLREPAQRLRKPGGERRQDGTLSRNQNRMGPLTLDARREALRQILAIQQECNDLCGPGVAPVDILNAEEVARINELIAAGTYPNKWDGDEPTGDMPFLEWMPDGSIQRNLYDQFGEGI